MYNESIVYSKVKAIVYNEAIVQSEVQHIDYNDGIVWYEVQGIVYNESIEQHKVQIWTMYNAIDTYKYLRLLYYLLYQWGQVGIVYHNNTWVWCSRGEGIVLYHLGL